MTKTRPPATRPSLKSNHRTSPPKQRATTLTCAAPARPFLYVIIAAMAYSLIVAPVINACLHKGLVPMQIPDSYLELFGFAFLGYTGARTWEKTKGLD